MEDKNIGMEMNMPRPPHPHCPCFDVNGLIANGKQFDLDITLPEDARDVVFGTIKNVFKEPIKDAVVKLIEIDFGKGRKYTYSLDNLFKKISTEKEITEKDRNHYIYYAKAKIYKRQDSSYSIIFLDKFLGNRLSNLLQASHEIYPPFS